MKKILVWGAIIICGLLFVLFLFPADTGPAPSVLDTFSGAPPKEKSGTGKTLYGFTAFPYDFSLEALENVQKIIVPNSTIYGVHYGLGEGNCIPWKEALEDKPFPQWMQDNWADIRKDIPSSHVVHITISPSVIGEDTAVSACGNSVDASAAFPFSSKRLDNQDVMNAYANYARRIMNYFQPEYISIGVEISEHALQHPESWSQYETLFRHTYGELKKERPTVQIGAEFILQSLLLPRVSEQVKPVVEMSDYLGISFYPYGSDFGEKYGAPKLPDPPDEWRKPLDWLRTYTDKPIAIVETGYMTKPLDLNDFDIHFPGSEDLQKAFTEDLVAIAKRDKYLFVIWFISVDYDRLLEKLPKESYEKHVLWTWTGFFDKDLHEKPAWSVWQEFKK